MHDVKLIRNVALFGHSKCGKTSIAEALLYTAGKTKRLGRVDDGSSVMDYEPEEIARKLTSSTSFHNLQWNKHEIFLMDTPGDDNFLNETRFAAAVADGAIFAIGAAQGVKHQTAKIAEYLEENRLPAVVFVTKMDRERANFQKVLDGIKESLPFSVAVTQIPIGAEADFRGVIDLISQKAYVFDGDSGNIKPGDIPAELADEAAAAREALMEKVAETDDQLIETFLEEGELSEQDLLNGLINGAKQGKLHPLLVGAALPNKNTVSLLEAIIRYLPSPEDCPPRTGEHPKTKDLVELPGKGDAPFSALVFKTISDPYAGTLSVMKIQSGTLSGDSMYNARKDNTERFNQLLLLEGAGQKPVKEAAAGMVVAVAKLKDTSTGDTFCTESNPILYRLPDPLPAVMAYAVRAAKKDDEDKLFSSLSKMQEEDPTLQLTRDTRTKQAILSGIGQLHLTVLGERIKRKFGVEMVLERLKVPYLETIKKTASAQGRHKKQSGGRGQFGDSWVEISPLPRGGGFEFEDRIVGGVIPRQYIPAVEKGILEAMENGVVAGYPMVDIKAAVYDGSYHTVDSSEMAFKISGSLAFKNAIQNAMPILLEPIMEMVIRVPKDAVGDVIGDLNSRRGKVMGMDSDPKAETITAQVPMAEVLEYAPELTSLTAGRGSFTMKMSHYEELPAMLLDNVIAAAKERAAS